MHLIENQNYIDYYTKRLLQDCCQSFRVYITIRNHANTIEHYSQAIADTTDYTQEEIHRIISVIRDEPNVFLEIIANDLVTCVCKNNNESRSLKVQSKRTIPDLIFGSASITRFLADMYVELGIDSRIL